MDRRDEVLPSLVRVFGGPNLSSDIDPSNKHSIAFESLLDAHNNNVPLVVCDSVAPREMFLERNSVLGRDYGWVLRNVLLAPSFSQSLL